MLLLDEPDANLDASGIRLVAMLVKDLSARKTMVAVAAHTQELAQLSASVFVELPARSAPESCCAK
jgi:energy-coupling factor transporter ATP-binding protein EcfA2